jgi:hypothetical protein
LNSLSSICRLTHNTEIRFSLQQNVQALSHNMVVIRQHDRRHQQSLL